MSEGLDWVSLVVRVRGVVLGGGGKLEVGRREVVRDDEVRADKRID